MVAVTVLAVWRERVAPGNCLPVEGLCMEFLLRYMACPAIHRKEVIVVREFFPFKIGMA